jgi:hypothetical protein
MSLYQTPQDIIQKQGFAIKVEGVYRWNYFDIWNFEEFILTEQEKYMAHLRSRRMR